MMNVKGSIAALLLAVLCMISGSAFAASAALNEGIALYNKGKYMESLGVFNQAKSTESDNPTLHYYMASALVKLNLKADAIREYKLTMALDPSGQLGKYSETALKSLEDGGKPAAVSSTEPSAKPPTASSKVGTKKSSSRNSEHEKIEKVRVDQQPQVVALLCGCPKCHSLDLTLTDLYSKFGDRIEFIRLMAKSGDPKSAALIEKYALRTCPSVLLVANLGEPYREFQNIISESELVREVEQLAKTSRKTRLKTIAEEKMAEQRKLVVDEVDARVSHDELRVNNSIRKIQEDLEAALTNIQNSDSRARALEMNALTEEAESKKKFLKEDFERRKKEYYAAAEARIRALQSTGGAKVEPVNLNRDFKK